MAFNYGTWGNSWLSRWGNSWGVLQNVAQAEAPAGGTSKRDKRRRRKLKYYSDIPDVPLPEMEVISAEAIAREEIKRIMAIEEEDDDAILTVALMKAMK